MPAALGRHAMPVLQNSFFMTSSDTPPKRQPGRPKVPTETRESILDAAELEFAAHGYGATALRNIADRVGINQSLIRYYFGNKEKLFDEVFRRRGATLSALRHAALDSLLGKDPARLTLQAVLHSYLSPQWDLKNSGESGAAFIRLQARLHAESEQHALRLRSEVYDASVRRYVDVLADLLPHLPKQVISLRMAFLVGTYMFMLNDLGRVPDFMGPDSAPLAHDAMLAHLVQFLASGFSSQV